MRFPTFSYWHASIYYEMCFLSIGNKNFMILTWPDMFIDDFEKSLRFGKFGKVWKSLEKFGNWFGKFGKVWKLVWKVWKSLEKYSFLDFFQTFQTNFQTFPNFSKLFQTYKNHLKKNIFSLSHMMNVVIFHHLSPIN